MEQIYTRIEAYLNNELNAADKAAFESEIALPNSALAKEMAFYLSAQKAAEEGRRDELKTRYQGLENRQKKQPNSRRWMAIAAAIAVLIAAIFFWPNGAPYDTPQQLADAFHLKTTIPEASAQMGDNEASQKAINEGIKAFQEKDFETASSKFGSILSTDPLFPMAQRLYGMTKYEQSEYRLAIGIFTGYLENNIGPKAEVLWWRALSYLQENQIAEARADVEEIITKDYANKSDAEALLKALTAME